MSKCRVIVELQYSEPIAEAALFAASAAVNELGAEVAPNIKGVKLDTTFAPIKIPGMRARTAMDTPYVSGEKFYLFIEPKDSTYIVRGVVDEEKIEEISTHKSVVGVYADIEIQPCQICPGSPPLGTDSDVERLLCTPKLHRNGVDGSGVLIAIVDTGFNLTYLASRGKTITLDASRSWVPAAGMTPGDAPVSHGTMCAYDAAIAAPRATFLDIQLLRSTTPGPSPMAGLLSDAIRAYSHLISIMNAPTRPGENRSMVVSNSWGMFHPSWDLPVGSPGNYSDNPNHPFNRIVSALEQAGADILFAAGNCGSNCPDSRCDGVTTNAIYGANSHPSVITVAGVDVTNSRVGYSTQGPGRLSRDKPDVCGYTHFQGSGVYSADGGTSAATPVVAGVVAAYRTRHPYSPGNPSVSPAAIRALLRSTASDLGTAGFDFDHGFGVVNCCLLHRWLDALTPPGGLPTKIDICRYFPKSKMCQPLDPRVPDPHLPPTPNLSTPLFFQAIEKMAKEIESFNEGDTLGNEHTSFIELALQIGYVYGQSITAAKTVSPQKCDCKKSES